MTDILLVIIAVELFWIGVRGSWIWPQVVEIYKKARRKLRQ